MAEYRVHHVMGMPVSIDVRDEGVALDPAFGWLARVDAVFSPFRADSEVSRLARGELALVDAPPLVLEVFDRCEGLRAETGGSFDAHASGRFDPSGLVKGWAVDRAARLLERAGARRFCINAGGDVLARGGPWRVGIRHPHDPRSLAAVVSISDAAVATSGAYERGEHILDPHRGRPPRGVLSVTVVGPALATADAYATAAFAMGEEGPAWTAGLRGHEAMTVLAGDRVLSTRGFAALTRPLSTRAPRPPARSAPR